MFALLVQADVKIPFKHLVYKEQDKWIARCLMTERFDYIFSSWEEYKNLYILNQESVSCAFMKKTNKGFTAIDHFTSKENKTQFLEWVENKRLII